MPQAAHITIAGQPYCTRLGCMAGQQLALQTGVDTCGHPSIASAKRAAKALRPHFCVPVTVVVGDCPGAPQ